MPTTNGVSPKAIAAVVTAVLTYILAQTLLELPVWAVLTGQAVLVGLAAWFAPPGDVANSTVGQPSDDALMASRQARRGMEGYGVVELLFALILVVILIWVLFALLPAHR